MDELRDALPYFIVPLLFLTLYTAGRIGRFELHEARHPRLFGASITCTLVLGYLYVILKAIE